MSESIGARLRQVSLGAKLILFSALLTAVTVSVAFFALSMELHEGVRGLLATTLTRHQRMLAGLQKRGLEELLRASTVMSDSPTLRAAMETYRSESTPGLRPRADLLATIETEAESIASGLARDLLIVTDERGRVLAATGRTEDRPTAGADLSAWPVVAHALRQDGPVGRDNFGARGIGGRIFQLGSVPIVLQGYIIGTLTLGERLDQGGSSSACTRCSTAIWSSRSETGRSDRP